MKIIIEGAGEVGSHLAKMLSHEANDIVVIDTDPARIAKLSATTDVVSIQGDPTSIAVLRKAGAETADLLVAVNPNVPQAVNIISAMLAKKIGTKRVTARGHDRATINPQH